MQVSPTTLGALRFPLQHDLVSVGTWDFCMVHLSVWGPSHRALLPDMAVQSSRHQLINP